MPATETKAKRTRNLGAIQVEIARETPGDWCLVGQHTKNFTSVGIAERWITEHGEADSRYRIIREVATFSIKTKRAAVRD